MQVDGMYMYVGSTWHTRTWMDDSRRWLDHQPVLSEGSVVEFGDEGDMHRSLASVGHYQTPQLRHQEPHVLETKLQPATWDSRQ